MDAGLGAWVADVAAGATLACGLLVFFATEGRHPAWVALMLVAVVIWWR